MRNFHGARNAWMLTVLCASLLALMPARSASAQYRASIQGTVTDPSGAAIPGAQIVLTDTTNNHKQSAKSNGEGIYYLEALPADTFNLVASAPGFSSKTLTGVTIIPEQANTLNIQLALGTTSESVAVNAGSVPALDTTTANISGTITSDQIQHMPSFNRDVFQLASLAPGMFGDNSMASNGNENNLPAEQNGGEQASQGIFTKGELTPQVEGNGGENNTSLYLIDGIPTASASWAGSTVIVPQEDSVQYMKVTANAYDAEYGRFSGAVIQVTSNTGTNAYHGSLFFKADRPGLNAWQRWNGANSVDPANASKTPANRGLVRDPQRFNQFGGSVGGPILHNRLFAFFAYETLRNDSVTTGTGLFETPSIDASAPAGSIAAKYLTLPGGAPAATGVIQSSCSSSIGIPDGPYCKTVNGMMDIGSPLKTALGTHDKTWTSNQKPGVGSGLDGIPDLEEVATVNPSTFVGSQYNGRMDADVTKKDRLGFIIYWAPNTTTSYNGPARPSNFEYASDINNAFTALWNHTFSPTLLNEARVSAVGYRYNLVAQNPQGSFGLPTDTFTGVGSSEPAQFGESIPGVFNQWTYTYQDIATKALGRHSLKAGFQLSRVEFLDEPVSNAHPSFTFESFWDFLNDAPVTESGTFNPVTGTPELIRNDDRQNIAGVFVQDDFKVSPTLTINAGLRWNYFGTMSDKENNLSVFTPGPGSALLTGASLVKTGSLALAQKGNFGPQLGFAWSPAVYGSKVVLRGGFGINFEENQIAITRSGDANVPNALSFGPTTAFSPQIVYNTAPNINSPFGYPANPNAISAFDSNNVPTSAVVSVYAFDNNPKTATVYHYSLDTEMQLPANFVAALGYQGSSGHHLFYEMDLNAYAVVRGFALNPHINKINDFVNGANSNYNAMLATLKHNFSRSFQLETDYTWSKSMDEGSTSYNEDPYAPISIHDAYGRSDYNFQNNFRAFGLYQPTFFHEGWLHAFADGWSLGGTYEYHAGFPWTPTYPVTATGLVGGASAHLYYENSLYTSIRPAAYTGRGINHSTAAFESGPSTSNPNGHNVNFPTGTGGENYFTPPVYTAAPNSAPFTTPYAIPGPAMERNSFTGPSYQGVNVSLAKGFNIPPARVIGEHASLEFRVDAFNLFNFQELAGTPTTNITSTTFGENTGALDSRTVELQSRFSF
ncbi:MAG TPA: TonB-dependent receptor [Acidobacteriaceae bacterium]|nr:TonB-dependent receptor [Acidobacteriaceae bacterium]